MDTERERLRSGDLDLDFDLDLECLDLERLLRRLRLRELRRLLSTHKNQSFSTVTFWIIVFITVILVLIF